MATVIIKLFFSALPFGKYFPSLHNGLFNRFYPYGSVRSLFAIGIE
jgi:hypothetical protein